jgi:hypothetical protein
MNGIEVLVIILSVFLAIFLVVGIVLTLLLIKVTLQIRSVTTKAERAALSFGLVAKNVSKMTSGAAVGSAALKLLKTLYRKKKGRRK